MIRVAVVGVTGYTGAELIRLLSGHPSMRLELAVGRSEAGRRVAEVFPHLHAVSAGSLIIEPFDADGIAGSADLCFLALPHGTAAEHAAPLLERGVRVVDLSADFRLKDPEAFRKYYGEHHAPDLFGTAVYGLPELHRAKLPGARFIAAPGCYVTATILAAAPLLHMRLSRPSIIADCKSGVSGAGRGLKLTSLFTEAGEGISAYDPEAHRHRPEIEQELAAVAGTDVALTFVPHLVPMTRGILATVYAEPVEPMDASALCERLAAHYAGEPFVRVLPPGVLPSTTHVRGSNYCFIGAASDRRAGRVMVVAALDNLVKGASGQAIQAANVALGLPESEGLMAAPLFP